MTAAYTADSLEHPLDLGVESTEEHRARFTLRHGADAKTRGVTAWVWGGPGLHDAGKYGGIFGAKRNVLIDYLGALGRTGGLRPPARLQGRSYAAPRRLDAR